MPRSRPFGRGTGSSRGLRTEHFVLPFLVAAVTLAFLVVRGGGSVAAAAGDPCAVPVTNPIACENSKPGMPPANWQIDGIGDESIQGFATAISVDVGETEKFKIKTPGSKSHLNIIRLGYYGDDGARMIEAGIKPSATLPQSQPECLHQEAT